MDNQQATQTELAWLGAIIDGEGYLTLAMRRQRLRKNYIACLEISNTEEKLIMRVMNIWKKIGVNPHLKRYSPKNGNKEVFKVDCHRMIGVKKILDAVIPYMCGKEERAKNIVQFISSRKQNPYSPYTDVELATVYKVQDLVRNGESSQVIRETLRKKPQR